MELKMDEISDIIREPVHGIQFYSREQLEALMQKVNEICSELEITENTPQIATINIINNFIKQNVSLRDSYFDAFSERVEKFNPNELVYRTAYGALVKGEAMCAGFVEAERILLSQYGIKTHTLLSKLPGSNKRLLHYVVLAEYYDDEGKHFITLDPERQKDSEQKGRDYENYRENMLYMLPTSIFTKDVVGETGVGMEAEDYIARSGVKLVKGTGNIQDLLKMKEERDENDGNR